jgi:AcrR family transcriptional regulator
MSGRGTTAPAPGARLTGEQRRQQLLDSAAQLLLEHGTMAVTMERLAVRAGVSKALPYRHFRDADDVLVELHRRELHRVTERVAAAVTAAAAVDDAEAAIRAAIAAYLDVIQERGDILAVLRAPGSPAANADAGDRTPLRFVASLLERRGLPPAAATVAGAAVYGALNGLIEAWAFGEVTRADVERTTLSLVHHLVKAEGSPDRAGPAVVTRRRARRGGTVGRVSDGDARTTST